MAASPEPADLATELVRRFYNDMWNHADVSVLTVIAAPDVRFRGSLGSERAGIRALSDYVAEVTTALADYRCEIVELVSERHNAAARMLFRGRHVGEFLGRQPTDRVVEWAGAAFFEIENERLADIWVLGNLVSLYAQLDA